MSQRVPSPIAGAYDPERFRADGHAVIDAIAAQLARAEWGKEPLSGGNLVEDLSPIMASSTSQLATTCAPRS